MACTCGNAVPTGLFDECEEWCASRRSVEEEHSVRAAYQRLERRMREAVERNLDEQERRLPFE